MSSFVAESYLRLHRSAIHPMLAISIPILFLLCLDAIARALLPTLTFPPPLFFLALISVGIEETVMANILFTERAGILARLRELLAVLLLAWVALGVMRAIEVHVVTLVHVDFIYPLALTATQWMCVWALHQCLREREILFSAIAGKQGEEMLHALRDASLQAEIAVRSLRAVKRAANLFQAVIFAQLLLAAALKISLGAQTLFLCALHALFGILVNGAVNMYIGDQLLLGEGIVMPARFEWSRMASIVAVPLACVPFVLLIARNDAPLSLSALLAFLERLFRSFPQIQGWRLADVFHAMLEQQRRYRELAQSLPAAPLSPAFLLFLFFLRRLIPAVLLMIFYFFLVSPLLSEEFLQSVRKRSLIDFLHKKARAAIRFIRRLARRIVSWLRSADQRGVKGERGAVEENAREGTGRLRARRAPLRKRLQVGRVLKAFLQLLSWGEGRGVRYRMFDTPKEYASRLAIVVPEMSAQLGCVVEVLEEALFSTHLLPGERIAAYFSSIREIRESPRLSSG
jgi:hypothetical protein